MERSNQLSRRRLARRVARLRSVQALFQMEASGADVDQVTADFAEGRFSRAEEEDPIGDADMQFFRMLVEGAVDNQSAIDQATDQVLVDAWPLGRIDPTLRALFRSACAELMSGRVPPKVTITEFVEITEAFFPDGRSSKLVNGVLDKLVRRLKTVDSA